jgi:hypothetical protein
MAKTMTLYPVNPPAFTSKQKKATTKIGETVVLYQLSYGLSTDGIRTRDHEIKSL